MSRRRLVVAAGLIAIVVMAGLTYKVNRDREWARGGDAVDVHAELRLAPPAGLRAASVTLGGASDVRLLDGDEQGVFVRVSWDGPDDGGQYSVIVLDRRVTPPRPLPVYGSWVRGDGQGSHWAGSYQVLSEHYDWLKRTAAVRTDAGWTDQAEAIGTSATARGALTGLFRVTDGDVPFEDPRDVLVALVRTDESGDVRWAKQVPLAR